MPTAHLERISGGKVVSAEITPALDALGLMVSRHTLGRVQRGDPMNAIFM